MKTLILRPASMTGALILLITGLGLIYQSYLVLCPAGFVYFVYRSADGTQRKIQVSHNSIEFGIALFRNQSILKQRYNKRRFAKQKIYLFIYLFTITATTTMST